MNTMTTNDLSRDSATILTNRIRIAVEGTWELIRDAYLGRAWVALGYSSWDEYTDTEFGAMKLRLPREERRDSVVSLREAGLSIRAIASGLGIGDKTVQRDLAGVVTDYTSEPEQVADAPEPIEVDPSTGEVVDAPRVEEHTVTEKTKITTGIDGKQYKRPEAKPKPKVLEGDALADYDARQNTKSISDALQTLDLMTTAAHRQRVTTIWWPRATENEEVPPWGRDLFKPEPIRQIAQALISLANELENQS